MSPLILSYLGLRKAVGIIGFSLPFVLALGKILLQSPGIEGSISCYYYTVMGNVFVGSMCAIGVFLISCRGFDRRDAIAGRLASAFAVGVALFPTIPCTAAATAHEKIIGILHRSFAALLFLTFAYFCLCLFTETAKDRPPTPQKLKRNTLYRVCGFTILGCILLIGLVELPALAFLLECHAIFWLESIAVISFGAAWLVKGETILKDP